MKIECLHKTQSVVREANHFTQSCLRCYRVMGEWDERVGRNWQIVKTVDTV